MTASSRATLPRAMKTSPSSKPVGMPGRALTADLSLPRAKAKALSISVHCACTHASRKNALLHFAQALINARATLKKGFAICGANVARAEQIISLLTDGQPAKGLTKPHDHAEQACRTCRAK